MKNGEVVNLFNTISKLTMERTIKFKIPVAYAMAKNKETLRQEVQIIEKLRNEIITDFSTMNEEGKLIVPKDKVPEVNKRIEELMELENEQSIIQVPVIAFENEKMNLEDMEGLLPMICLSDIEE